MAKHASQFSFSCDLVQQSKDHIIFLRNLHKHGVTLTKPSHEAIRRYSELWLPLVYSMKQQNEAESEDLIPPADIAWLWHCHRLAPYRYANYVQTRFFDNNEVTDDDDDDDSFKVLDASHPFMFQLENNDENETLDPTLLGHTFKTCKRTIELFHQMYPDETFFLTNNIGTEECFPGAKIDGFDVIKSCYRQASFLWQVSGDNFCNDEFLCQGVENYTKFVRLMGQKQSPQFLVPTYQVDLMWRSHMLSSIANYHKDNIRMNGSTLEHNDSLNDRTEGGKLDTNFQATRKMWREVYGDEYKVHGGMYRGEPPVEYFKPDWPDQCLRGNIGKPNLLNGVAVVHLIGQVGASSHGEKVWMSFVVSAAIGVNSNEQRDGYVFGKGGK